MNRQKDPSALGLKIAVLLSKNRTLDWAKAFGLTLLGLGVFCLYMSLEARAAEEQMSDPVAKAERNQAKKASATDSEYDFSWLDPDKKVFVLQNRKYLKAERFMLSALTGPGLSGAYRSVWQVDFRGTYYPTETFGVELFFQKLFNSANSTQEALEAASTALPNIREVRSKFGVMAQWVPWYAKINFFNKILYFDWYLQGGLGSVQTAVDQRTSRTQSSNYLEQSRFAGYLSTGHLYHLNESITVRLDITGALYRAPIFGTSGRENLYSDWTAGAGIGVRF